MTTNIVAAVPMSAAASCQPSAGSPRCGSPRGTGPSTATPWLARSAARLTMIAAITAISGPGILWPLRGGPARRQHDHDDPDRHRHVGPVYLRECARDVQQPGRGALVRDGYPQHVGELPGGHLNPDASEESQQDGPGQEIRQEPEPGQPGHQQQPAREQRRQPGQPDVLRRARDRQPGEGRAQYGRRGRIRAHDEMPRRAEDGEYGHRQQQRVQARHHRHPGDLRVPENLGDAQGGQRYAGQHVRGYLGPADGQQPAQHRKRPQPRSQRAPAPIRHSAHLRPHFPAVPDPAIIPGCGLLSATTRRSG